eukprot:12074115-Prorocentrum_lima.AAC.1
MWRREGTRGRQWWERQWALFSEVAPMQSLVPPLRVPFRFKRKSSLETVLMERLYQHVCKLIKCRGKNPEVLAASTVLRSTVRHIGDTEGAKAATTLL